MAISVVNVAAAYEASARTTLLVRGKMARRKCPGLSGVCGIPTLRFRPLPSAFAYLWNIIHCLHGSLHKQTFSGGATSGLARAYSSQFLSDHDYGSVFLSDAYRYDIAKVIRRLRCSSSISMVLRPEIPATRGTQRISNDLCGFKLEVRMKICHDHFDCLLPQTYVPRPAS